jgi:hypothetical protein
MNVSAGHKAALAAPIAALMGAAGMAQAATLGLRRPEPEFADMEA